MRNTITLNPVGKIRFAQTDDGAAICDIYNYYVSQTTITFDEKLMLEQEMSARIESVSGKLPWLVYESEGKVLGYACASEWKSRCAYKYSVESSVYLHPGESGKGIGSMFYSELLDELRKLRVHSVIGGISLPNPASIALHEKLGFKKAGQFTEVGYKFNQWIDVGYWELILNYNP